jgi:hypothetical protein
MSIGAKGLYRFADAARLDNPHKAGCDGGGRILTTSPTPLASGKIQR